MRKLIENIRKFLRIYILTLLISLVSGTAIFCLLYFLRGKGMVPALDGTGVAGVVLVSIGVLCLIARYGAFDTMSYGFKQMFASLFAKEANKYNDMSEYKEQKNTVRKVSSSYYYVIIFVGVLFLIAFLILEIYRLTNYN